MEKRIGSGVEGPDLAARELAEGDLEFEERPHHLCWPETELSSHAPVESGALEEED